VKHPLCERFRSVFTAWKATGATKAQMLPKHTAPTTLVVTHHS